MAYILEREQRGGVFELARFRSITEALTELVALHRRGDRSCLRIWSDVTGELAFRSDGTAEGVSVVPCIGTSQRVQVKTAVESHFGTVPGCGTQRSRRGFSA